MHNNAHSDAKHPNVNSDRETLLQWKYAEKQMIITVVTKGL